MAEPVWLREELILYVHRRQILQHGGSLGIRDPGLLEASLARPRQVYAYEPNADMARLAAAYAWAIVRNHPFVDGNKRVALVACRVFLRLNGYDLSASAEDKYRMFMGIASGGVSEDQFTDWIREHLVPASSF
ncbi:MAG: type II toxin-antitoxin system death-on-curing family toxin [Firmicutes bacterium]|nr:type II toxin-antitoxin system death-on-curing family toxin [Bacillota bacterium]